MISRRDRLLYFPSFTKTCSTVSFGYDRHNSAMQSVSRKKVWRHRRVTLTESRPSGSIATGKGNQARKFFSYLFMRKSLTAKRSIEISVLPGNREVQRPGTKWCGQSEEESMQGNPHSRIKKFLLVESGILSFGTSRTIRIQNPNFTDKDWNLVQLYLESGIHGVESRIYDCLRESAWL